ncbi:(Na+)-NQR maturation NqrM [Gallaecimonas xiamenensis]|uniref:Na(+)-translocating NADH-quinone reductase subunit E n=1 Tax=Gallaecimonas xiamenensis 3-C-1 TaxID=745411 RepID=K2K4H1_9GAMM|nr:(Na+)-NQR maturation NqrM [Gallaecimonas xiamenensis]EKE72360.1 Na(+)-translocating NADH-quinone reductase subunit E [Gallaecimonas xiamenensis 3-C-1]
MMVFVYTFGLFLLVVAAMAVGYIFQKKSISGSCGGISGLGMEKACDCPDPCDKRKARMAKEEAKRKAKEAVWQENRIL